MRNSSNLNLSPTSRPLWDCRETMVIALETNPTHHLPRQQFVTLMIKPQILSVDLGSASLNRFEYEVATSSAHLQTEAASTLRSSPS